VIDECHEPSFKQEQTPRYSALRAASVLADKAGARLVLGSATPSVSDYYLATITGKPVISLPLSARKNTVKPSVELIDMTKKTSFTKHRFLSNQLISQITESIAGDHQVLLFHNRRGSAPMTLCEQCGWSAACSRCFIPLTLHSDSYELRCHVCNYVERVPTSCPSCGNASVIHKGIGTKLVAEELQRLFPKARIMRFDGDSAESDTLEKHYQALYDGDVDIIVGTQVVAKGLDLPHLRVVGVIQADSGLALPDYSSTERVFQLLAQVSGRVGRNEHESHVIVQSYQPEHPSVALGIQQDYAHFYEFCLAERKRGLFPPFTYLLKLTCVYKSEAAAVRAARDLARTLRREAPAGVTILGPAPAFYERVRDTYRWQLTIKSPSRPDLITLLTHVPKDRWQYELDPSSLL
jgi:primosomal protein N' (replication factor Y)